jgi:hypothetical protein
MSRNEFIKLAEGMTEAQKVAAFDHLTGALSVIKKENWRHLTEERIEEAFAKSCHYGRVVNR